MRALSVLLYSGCCLMSGCTASAPSWPWVRTEATKPLSICKGNLGTCTEEDVIENLAMASSFCRDVHNHYESFGFSSNSVKMTIATVGTLSGAVFAPLGKGSATKAWAGLSGSTNALQAGLDQSFSTTLTLKSQAAVNHAYVDSVADVERPGTNEEKVQRIVFMAAKCAMAAGDAQLNALKSAINAPASSSVAVPNN